MRPIIAAARGRFARREAGRSGYSLAPSLAGGAGRGAGGEGAMIQAAFLSSLPGLKEATP